MVHNFNGFRYGREMVERSGNDNQVPTPRADAASLRSSRLSRREALASVTLSGVCFATACGSPRTARAATPDSATPDPATPDPKASPVPTPPALAGTHQPVPLPFAPGSLRGLSEPLIRSHHENNYGGAVRNLNRTEQELRQVTKDTPPLVVVALRDRELLFRNSKGLHEAYFANLGGDGRRSGGIEAALAQAYGSSAVWEEHFRATGMGLGGGSGWVVAALELETGALRTVGMASHKEALSLAIPLLVMDMYEHSYQMDFGAAAGRYIDAFFANVNWDEVNRRFESAQRLSQSLREGPG